MTRTIGEAIEGRLHEMKIKPEELATVLDVPLPTLSGWLWLENDIPAQYILKIAHVLRCTPTYLLSGGEDDRETPTKSNAIEDLIRATVAEVLRQHGIECEYADPRYLVLMFTPENPPQDYDRLREAIFAPQEVVPAEEALGRVCAMPTVSCPPAIPIVVSGEMVSREAVTLMKRYGVANVAVIK